jgi:peptidoglycan-N-acetylglucosamine deacetylase
VERAQQEINDGIASVTWALGDGTAPAPFFRIPGLLRADGVERYLASQHLMVWSADFPADDWTRISPAQVYTRALQRIEANRKGILLLHDIQPRTVEALPYLLRELKRRGYRIVHIVPARPDLPKTVTDPRQWIMHARMTWPRVPIYVEAESESELPAPSPSSFGVASPFDSRSVTRAALPRARTVLARRQIPLPPVSIWPRSLDEPAPAPPSGRPVLPAPSPQSFGYPADTPAPSPPQPKASLNLVPPSNLVPETTGKEIDIRRLILESERASEDPAVTGSVPAPLLRDPAATGSVPAPLREPAPTAPTAQMPRGAFP